MLSRRLLGVVIVGGVSLLVGTNIAAAIASSDQPSFEYKEYAAAENAIAPSKQMACNQRGGVKCFVGETTGLLMLPNAVLSRRRATVYG